MFNLTANLRFNTIENHAFINRFTWVGKTVTNTSKSKNKKSKYSDESYEASLSEDITSNFEEMNTKYSI